MKWYKIPESNKLKPFNFIIGGRGIGKTYSAIHMCVTEFSGRFMYLRNTREQLQESCGAFGNPFKKWANDHKLDIVMEVEKKHAVINSYLYDQGETIKEMIGTGANLSTFENLRGIDQSNCELILYDEFIENRTLSFDQYKAFLNMYETVNRNRELEEKAPLKVLLLSNAQRLGNPILRGFNLIPVIENMQKNNQRIWTNETIRIELPFSEVSEAKRKTALYQASNGSDYNAEALDNNFINDSFAGVRKVNINEYIPIVCIDDIYIYKHKSDSIYYACAIKADCKRFRSIDNFIIFYRLYGMQFKLAIASDKFYFSDYSTKIDILTILKMIY